MVKYNAVGAYIYAGGFSIGVQRHFNVLAHLENGDYGVSTVRLNFPQLPVYTDVADWPLRRLSRQKVDFVFTNPPCAVWSTAGRSGAYGKDWTTDARLSCVEECFSVLVALRPKVWVWESVCQAYIKGRPFVDSLTKTAASFGYGATYFLSDAALHGAPQHRRRFMCIFHNIELPFERPIIKRLITSGEVLENIEPSEVPKKTPRHVLLYNNMRPGETAQKARQRINDTKNRFPRLGFLCRKIDLTKPCHTIVGQDNIHPSGRLLTVTEVAALCTFPPKYRFVGSFGGTMSLMARGVLPCVGEYIAKVVRRGIDQNIPLKKGYINEVDYRNMVKTLKNQQVIL